MDKKELAENINEAINELLKKGHSSTLTNSLRNNLESVLDEAAPKSIYAIEKLKRVNQELLDKVIKHKGLPVVSIFSENGENSQSVQGVGIKDFDNFEPEIRLLFDECVKDIEVSASFFRRQELDAALNVFTNWAESIPIGGTKDKSFRNQAREVRLYLKAFQKWDSYYFIAKNGNFISKLKHLAAKSNGAIAASWCFYKGNGCIYSEHEDHNEEFFLIRNSWAIQQKLIASSNTTRYTDELTTPRSDGCTCSYRYIFSLSNLPNVILTSKGKQFIIDTKNNREKIMKNSTNKDSSSFFMKLIKKIF